MGSSPKTHRGPGISDDEIRKARFLGCKIRGRKPDESGFFFGIFCGLGSKSANVGKMD